MITTCGITRPYGRTCARTHLGTMGSLGTLELTCGFSNDPSGIIGGIDGNHRNHWTDLRILLRENTKPQVTPNNPNDPTPHAKNPTNNPTVKPQVNSNNPNNPTHFVSTRTRVRARRLNPEPNLYGKTGGTP